MAGVKPFFLTGDKLKIKLNGKTIAFATDLTCSIQILHQTPHVLGMYEGVSVEPLSYNIAGSFSIIRYVHNAIFHTGISPDGVNSLDICNSAGTWGKGDGYANALATLGGTGGRAFEALDPSMYSQGTTFDIEVYQRFKHAGLPEDDPCGVIKIRSVRITKADFSVSKKSGGTDRFECVALYVDNYISQAKPSGTGQQNS